MRTLPQALGSNAGASFASKTKERAARTGMAGAFTMGDSLDALGDATPTVSTTAAAFYMDVNEVTLNQWQSVYYWATSNGYTFAAGVGKGPNHPAHTVSWYDVVKWWNAHREQAGKTPVYYTDDAKTTINKTGNVNVTNAQAKWTANGYRLPTEAEWEKAARGGFRWRKGFLAATYPSSKWLKLRFFMRSRPPGHFRRLGLQSRCGPVETIPSFLWRIRPQSVSPP